MGLLNNYSSSPSGPGVRRLQVVSKGLGEFTEGYKGLQEVTKGYKGLQGVKGSYKGLQGLT